MFLRRSLASGTLPPRASTLAFTSWSGSIRSVSARQFSATSPSQKKKGGSHREREPSSEDAEPAALSVAFDAKKMQELMDGTLKLFGDKIKELKQGQATTERFASLDIALDHGKKMPLKALATISARGTKINIVAFDPKQIKYIQSAIVSQMNMPAEPSKTDNQTLSVAIPVDSQAKKDAQAKEVKELFENFRNNVSNRHSLASIRQKYLAPLKKAAEAKSGVSKDVVKKTTTELENIAKKYQQKLQDLCKK